ncbi:tetraacyldisaccharide 4'-kinase [Oleiagrimonas sp. C23AA]|uniref:tetraacyldisaccharide 4'-kinase n=1 Tax=Oleiagrimonas sp. C23AA TaxID=2719047 RepID=UPI0014216FDC|nr:tetraacyldisaccharide 4'-kinase [Oleiagrimonas sp. C23AA]NII10912.1 tetraacyldisaccharide 4'-kinase [Oleiagrimonas sp. C23AA]
MEGALLRRWYSKRPAPWLLRPLAGLYRGLSAVRLALYRCHWLTSQRLPVPVLVVGNISLGGTGKTPLVIALVQWLREQGWQPGVVSRGYGGKHQVPELLDASPDPVRVGDEPCLIRERTGARVAVGRDRATAAQLVIEAGADIVLTDDGLQHYRLQRDLEICVIDGSRRFGNGWVLPAGPLREPVSRLRSVDFRVCNGGMNQSGEVLMRLLGDVAQPLREGAPRGVREFAGRRIHAVAGIGHPQRFFDTLRVQGIDVIEHAFPDHHAYTVHDLAFGDDLPVLMTEKDAIKCQAFAQDHWWSVPVRAVLPEDFYRLLGERLKALAHP